MSSSEPNARPRPRRSRRVRNFLLALAAGLAVFVAFRQGLLPARYTPLPVIDVEHPWPFIVDWQLAELISDKGLCARALKAPVVEATPILDRPKQKGCGWQNNVKLSSVGGIRIGVDTLSCQEAAALAAWILNDVDPLAQRILGQHVKAISHLGSYACRGIVGNPMWKGFLSEHASANAIDVSAFELANGRTVSVAHDFRGKGPEAEFLHAVHDRACRYFRVVLGPDANAAHHDHFHLDRGPLYACR